SARTPIENIVLLSFLVRDAPRRAARASAFFSGFSNFSFSPIRPLTILPRARLSSRKEDQMKLVTRFRQQLSGAVMVGLAVAVMAIPGTAWSSLRDDIRELHLFLRHRPRVAADLRANP